MKKLAIVKVGDEITGVYLSSTYAQELGGDNLEVDIIDFNKALDPWADKTIEQIEECKLVKIA